MTNIDRTIYNDQLFGTLGADLLRGFGGNDHLSGGLGADTLDGGLGIDTVAYFDSQEGVRVVLGDGTPGRGYGGTAEGDRLLGIEDVTGSKFNDWIEGNAQDNVLRGAGGVDVLYGLGGDDELFGIGSLLGGEGDDTLTGGGKLFGGAGHDTFSVGGPADHIDGGTGIDTLSYAASFEAVSVNLGDTLQYNGVGGTAQGDVIRGIENLGGSRFGDILRASDTANLLDRGGRRRLALRPRRRRQGAGRRGQ